MCFVKVTCFLRPAISKKAHITVTFLKNTVLAGHDEIPIKVFKSVYDSPLLYLINILTEIAIFSDDLKRITIMPALKKETLYQSNFTNYRQ